MIVIFVLGVALWATLALINATLVFQQLVLKRRVPSPVPLLGGLIGTLSFAFAPVAALHLYAWVPFLADVGAGPYLAIALTAVARSSLQHRAANTLADYLATNLDRRKARLRLFKHGAFLIELSWERGPGEAGMKALSFSGNWTMEPGKLILSSREGDLRMVFDRQPNSLRQLEGSPGLEKSPDTSLRLAAFVKRS